MLMRTEAFRSVQAVVSGDIEHVSSKTIFVSGGGGSPTHTTSFAVATSGPNRLLVVGVGLTDGGNLTGLTYNGVALTQAVSNDRSRLWYMLDEDLPTDGASHDLVATFADSWNCIMCPAEYKNVAQGVPAATGDDASNFSAECSILLSSLATGSLVVSTALSTALVTIAHGGSQTERHHGSGTHVTITGTLSDIVGASGNTTVTEDPSGSSSATQQCAASWEKAA